MRLTPLTIFFSALLLFSCSKKEVEGVGKAIDFREGASKASMPGIVAGYYDFIWDLGDQIAIWYTADENVTFSGPGKYRIANKGDGSWFEYRGGVLLRWSGEGIKHSFVSVHPYLEVASPTTGINLGGWSIIDKQEGGLYKIYQAAANDASHLKGKRMLMVAGPVDFTSPSGEELGVENIVTLDFRPSFSYLEYHLSGTPTVNGVKVKSVTIATNSKSAYFTPAPDAPRFNIWSNSFPNYWNQQTVTLEFTDPVEISRETVKGWIPLQPGDHTGSAFTFTIRYTDETSKETTKSGVALRQGAIRSVALDVTPQ